MVKQGIISITEKNQASDFNSIIRNLENLSMIRTLTREWWAYKKKAIEELKKDKNHIEFSTSYLYRTYSLTQVGSYVVISISHNRRGYLKKFKRKLVFVACIGSGDRDVRRYIAVEMPENTAKLMQLAVINSK